jgi:hypothetical protein
LAHIRGRPPSSDERARKDGRKHRDAQEREVWIQQAEGKKARDIEDGRAAFVSVVESEPSDEEVDRIRKREEDGPSVKEKMKRENEKEAGGDQPTEGKTRYFFSIELCDTL